MKKISKIIFALTLIFMLNTNVKAVTITIDNTKQGTTDTNGYLVTNKGNITINNVGTDTFKGYKILDYYYNSTENSLSYEFTDNFKTFLSTTTNYKTLTVAEYRNLSSGDTTNGSTQTTSTLDTLMSQYASYISSNSLNGVDLTTASNNATGNLTVGSYLIVPTNTSEIYAVMVGNIDLKYENSTWSITDSTIVSKKSSTSIVKTILNGATLNNNKYYINTGNVVTSRLTIAVPEFPTNANNHQLEVNFDEGVGVEITSITIKDGSASWNFDSEKLTSTYDATFTDNHNNKVGYIFYIPQMTILEGDTTGPSVSLTFNTDYINSDSIIIEYTTDITINDENIGSQGIASTYGMKTSPYDDELLDDGWYELTGTSSKNNFTLYSYGIKINTKDTSNNNLNGAEYKLYSDATLNTEVGSFTTNNSVSTITGLAPGTYYVKQVTAPTGSSNVNTETFTVNLEESQEGYLELNVTNTTGLLPVTGGIGTLLFGIVGLLVIIGAIAYYKVNQKKKLTSAV